jgi:ABC-type lipoprotein release transport system permease subunit
MIPAVTLQLSGYSVAKITSIGLLVAVVSSVVPVRRVVRLDPVSAFHVGG